MVNIQGEHIYLRAIEPSDLDFLYHLENDSNTWEISGTITPYSKAVLELYLENAHRDIYDVKQLRLCICSKKDVVVGLIDLFDFDPKNKRAGLGLIISDEKNRDKGMGAEAIGLMCDYAFNILNLHQLYANVLAQNVRSIHVFEKLGFVRIGIKKDWICSASIFKDEVLYQKIKS